MSHIYDGALPPLVEMALNVTPVPEHIGLAEGDTVTDEVKIGLTVKLILLEEAGLPNRQTGNVPPAVSMACTISPSAGK